MREYCFAAILFYLCYTNVITLLFYAAEQRFKFTKRLTNMKKAIFYLVILAGVLVGIGCKKDASPAAPPTTADLRIMNATPWTFYDCIIDPTGTLSDNPGPNAHHFGQIENGATTNYQTLPKLYRYAWVRLTMNNKTYYIKPYDYTGEKVLESGQYTYKLTYTTANDELHIELIKD